jgi:hypothetical protein
MTLSISLSEHAEARLRERAAAAGRDPAAYAAELVERAVSGPDLERVLEPLRAEFAASGASDEELVRQITEARRAHRDQR